MDTVKLIGAAKSGTTRFCWLLNRHPNVFVPWVKEPGYFCRHRKNARQLRRYLSLYEDAERATAAVDATTGYSRRDRFPCVAERIYEFNPGARIIYLVRHPMARIVSEWVQGRAGGGQRSDFQSAVRASRGLVQASRYYFQIVPYIHLFGDDRVLILFFENFVADENTVVREALGFVGLEPRSATEGSAASEFGDSETWEEGGYNSARVKREAGALLHVARALPGYPFWRPLIPRRLRILLRPRLTRPVAKPQWDRATWDWAVDQIREDSEQLLEYCKRDLDFWSWDYAQYLEATK